MRAMYAGRFTGTMALTEPQAGSSLAGVQTLAQPTAARHSLMSGNKVFISGGDHDASENIVHLALARIAGAPAGIRGVSPFAVPHKRFERGKRVPNDCRAAGVFHELGWRGIPSRGAVDRRARRRGASHAGSRACGGRGRSVVRGRRECDARDLGAQPGVRRARTRRFGRRRAAQRRLSARARDHRRGLDVAALRAVAEERLRRPGADRAHCEGKRCAAQCWFKTELPRVHALAQLCRENEDSYARMQPDWF
jgi:alkylation response protein AidB-like acyl-CoA dehydrogenase